MPSRFYVTTPIYYINDVPHLGTAYTTIAADVLARYHRLRGEETFFLTGTDEHGLKLERVAKEHGLTPRVFSDRMNAPFRETWPKLDCQYDYFVRTTDPDHEKRVGELWEKIKASGDLYLGSYEGFYCVGCEAYYTEKELEEGGICPLHKTRAELIREPSYFFKLGAYGERLLAFYDRRPSFVQPTTRLNEVKSFVRGGLDDLSVSRTTFSWGVPVPGDPSHVMYVWFEALFSYLTPMMTTPERRAFWPANVHLVGKDILRFHAVYWPALLMSAGMSDDEIPGQVYAHGFLTFNGQKMSKSLRNTVAPVALAEAFGIDTLRYYLMRAIAFGQDGDFNLKELISRYNADLGNALGNLLNRVLKQCEKVSHGKFPERGENEALEAALLADLATGAQAAADAFDAISPHRALEAVWQVVSAANQYIDRAAPWSALKRGDMLRASTILATTLDVLEAVSVMIWPVMPAASDRLRSQLGLAPTAPTAGSSLWPLAHAPRAAGTPLGAAVPLFPRIDPDQEKVLIERLGLAPAETPGDAAAQDARHKGVGAAPPKNEGSPPATDAGSSPIAYDDFAKVDLRVGVVVGAERVKGKDKLLSLKVDVGEAEPRPIVAGLALTFQPEALVGTRVLVVVNLEPRKFGKGLVSHGMLLAAGPSEALKMATVDASVPPGTKVK
ncbi:MAG TPA: methionine--tRNA ligase [Polyangiaceae bacterium]|nr:methionine--tRNA ligase [Polyangiaceae bacterium]